MKCPSCGDDKSQERLGPVGEQSDRAGYRCAVCGHLYMLQVPRLDELADRLEAIQAKTAGLAAEQERLAAQLDEIRAQIQAKRGE